MAYTRHNCEPRTKMEFWLVVFPIMMAPVSCAGGFLAVFEDYFYFFKNYILVTWTPQRDITNNIAWTSPIYHHGTSWQDRTSAATRRDKGKENNYEGGSGSSCQNGLFSFHLCHSIILTVGILPENPHHCQQTRRRCQKRPPQGI